MLSMATSLKMDLQIMLGYASFCWRCCVSLLKGVMQTAYNLIQNEVSSAVFSMILKNAGRNGMLLHLWHVNPSMLVWGFADAFNADQNVSRVLDACLELKILSPVLDMIPSPFAIGLAARGSRKELIDLEKWLTTYLTTYKDAFYEECHKFLKEVQLVAQEVSTNRFQPSGPVITYRLVSTCLKKWKNCICQICMPILDRKMVAVLIHQLLMVMLMILSLKQTLISIKCFLVN